MKELGDESKRRSARAEQKPDIEALFEGGVEIDRALARGVRDALIRHRKLGQSVAVWRDGRVVEIMPHEIPEFDEPNS